jgi:hypothetical protein
MIQSDSGIWYPAPLEKSNVIVPLTHRPRPMAVRFRTWICDGNGKIIREGQSGWNTITDYGMDFIAGASCSAAINYLVVSSALGPAKKVLSGGTTLSITSTADPTNLAVVASANFFAAGDVNNTLYIDALGQELKIIAYTDQQHVTCATRPGVWLPGITPGTGPFATAGVHYTATNTVATEITRFNSYDTTATNNNVELTDYTNSRFIHQRIYLSGVVSGSPWTINQLAWSPNFGAGNNVFGKVNLVTPDNVAVGQKYRVQLDLYSGYTPINISSFSANWGATIGTYDLQIRTEFISGDTATNGGPPFLSPSFGSSSAGVYGTWFTTAAFTMHSAYFFGDPSGPTSGQLHAPAGSAAGASWSDASYVSNTFKKVRTWTIIDTLTVTAATGIGLGAGGGNNQYNQIFAVKPNSGTITKPSGYWAALSFPIYWTRAFVN